MCGTVTCGEGLVEASVAGQCCPTCVPEVTTVTPKPQTTSTNPTCDESLFKEYCTKSSYILLLKLKNFKNTQIKTDMWF